MRDRRLGLLVGALMGVAVVATALAQGLPTRRTATWRVVCTATTSHAVASRDRPRAVTFGNLGTINVYLGSSDDAVPRITLHAGATRSYTNTFAGFVCGTVGEYGGTGTTTLEVEEELP